MYDKTTTTAQINNHFGCLFDHVVTAGLIWMKLGIRDLKYYIGSIRFMPKTKKDVNELHEP